MFSVDKSLNFGRVHIASFARSLAPLKTVLDVGAGFGSDIEIIRKSHPQADYLALEYYDEYARKLEAKNIKTYQVNFEREDLPLDDESLDLIVSNQVMEHTKEVFWVLHEMSRTLKVGGHLIVGVPNLASLHNRLLLALGRQPTCIQNNSAHIRGYTKSDFLKLLDVFPGGYEVVDFGGGNFYPFSAWLARPLAKLFPSMAWSIFFLIKKTKKYDQNYFLKFPVEQKLETNFYLG